MPQQRIPIKTYGSIRQHFALEADGAYIVGEQDCNALIDENKRLSNQYRGLSRNGTAIAARVPAILRYMEWPTEFEMRYGCHPDHPPPGMKQEKLLELGAAWAAFYKSKLNHPDYRHLRTDGGKRL